MKTAEPVGINMPRGKKKNKQKFQYGNCSIDFTQMHQKRNNINKLYKFQPRRDIDYGTPMLSNDELTNQLLAFEVIPSNPLTQITSQNDKILEEVNSFPSTPKETNPLKESFLERIQPKMSKRSTN